MPTIHVNGINIEYESHGDGEPLVLIAGLGYSRWMWHKMVPGLAKQFRVITFDNRGVGNSDKPAGPYTAVTPCYRHTRTAECTQHRQSGHHGAFDGRVCGAGICAGASRASEQADFVGHQFWWAATHPGDAGSAGGADGHDKRSAGAVEEWHFD